MKVKGRGQAKILSSEEIAGLFRLGLKTPRDKALFGICLYCGARIAEACKVLSVDIYEGPTIREWLTLRKESTKGKIATRSIPISSELGVILSGYSSKEIHFFPGHHNGIPHLHPSSADKIFREACQRVGIVGASTHSLRRTCLTRMHRSNIPLRVIQKISGHRSLATLQKYLEVEDRDLEKAVRTVWSYD